MAQRTPPPEQPTDPEEVEVRVASAEPADVPPVEEAEPGVEWGAPAAAPAPGSDAPPQLFTLEAVERSVSAGFAMLAERRGPHWSVTPAEAASIAEPLTGELNELAQHFPGYGVAAAAMGGRRMQLAAAVAVVCGPRLYADMQLARERAAAERRAELERRQRRADHANGHDAGAAASLADELRGLPRDN